LPNVGLFFAGIVGIIVAICTLKIIQRQTEAVKDSVGVMKDQHFQMRLQTVMLRNSVRVAADTAQRQLRAYVNVKESLLKFSGSVVEGQIHIQNFGQTPAYAVRHWIHLCVERWPLQIVLPEPPEDFQMSKTVLAPSGKHIMVGQLGGNTRPAPEITLGQHPTRTVYVYGRITYKDAFGDDRYTEYRLTFGGREVGRKFNDTNGTLCGRLQEDKDGNNAN
jgi:hypothetical protein